MIDYKKILEIVEQAEYFSGAIQIVDKGEIKLNVAAGYAKREDEISNNINTAFGIASGTKGFTALGVLRLLDQGRLSLEDLVFEKIPFEFPNMNKAVTVRHLLSHTSGIYDYFDEEVVEDFGQLFDIVPINKILGPSDMLPLLIEGNAYFEPGESYKYCNSSFVILGMLIEAISGMDYADFIQKEVCKPLGLDRTGCYKTNQLPKNCAYGYLQDESGNWYSNIFEIPIVCTADGGLLTTTGDITKMWKGIISGEFLSKKTMSQAFTSQVEIKADWCENLHYGLGFFIQKDKESKVKNFYLVGGDPGISFSTNYYVDEDRIVTILGNTSDSADRLREDISTYLD